MVEDGKSAGPLESVNDQRALLPGHVHRGQHPEEVMVWNVGELEALPAPKVQTARRRVNVATGERAGGAAPVEKQTIARVHHAANSIGQRLRRERRSPQAHGRQNVNLGAGLGRCDPTRQRGCKSGSATSNADALVVCPWFAARTTTDFDERGLLRARRYFSGEDSGRNEVQSTCLVVE